MKTSWKAITIGIVFGLVLLLLLMLSTSDKEEEQPVTKERVEIPEPKEEVEVTDMYLPLRNSEKRKTPITHVVIHFVSNVTEKPEDPYHLEDIRQIFVDYGVSSHYLIDREGNIHRFVSEDRIAYHAGTGSLENFPHYEDQLNEYSIGIELMAIGTKEEMAEFIDEETYEALDPSFIGYTDAQYDSLAKLLDAIHERYPEVERSREHVVGHDEYAPDRKTDPGSLFDWSRLGYE